MRYRYEEEQWWIFVNPKSRSNEAGGFATFIGLFIWFLIICFAVGACNNATQPRVHNSARW